MSAPNPDFNLLLTLDVLLAENNVARAAKRLRLSSSAISRALARLRKTTGDPLLVRAERGLIPTPRALALRESVTRLVQEAGTVLSPATEINIRQLTRTFTLRTSEGFVENFGAQLVACVAREAPGVKLHFIQKPNKDSAPLREGWVDLETGVVEKTTSPEIRTHGLFRDRLVGVVRKRHPLAKGRITPERFVRARHIAVSRPGQEQQAVDSALERLELERNIAVMVGSFSSALGLARTSDLVACVPERHTGVLREGLHTFRLPVPTPEVLVSLLWHPRLDADPAHRWLRSRVREICPTVAPRSVD